MCNNNRAPIATAAITIPTYRYLIILLIYFFVNKNKNARYKNEPNALFHKGEKERGRAIGGGDRTMGYTKVASIYYRPYIKDSIQDTTI